MIHPDNSSSDKDDCNYYRNHSDFIDRIKVLPQPRDKRNISGYKKTENNFKPTEFLFNTICLRHGLILSPYDRKCQANKIGVYPIFLTPVVSGAPRQEAVSLHCMVRPEAKLRRGTKKISDGLDAVGSFISIIVGIKKALEVITHSIELLLKAGALCVIGLSRNISQNLLDNIKGQIKSNLGLLDNTNRKKTGIHEGLLGDEINFRMRKTDGQCASRRNLFSEGERNHFCYCAQSGRSAAGPRQGACPSSLLVL